MASLKTLPTPTGDDANNVTRESGEFRSLAREVHRLLPTPTTQDGANTAGPSQHHRNSKPLNVTVTRLLPTPVANPDNPGSGGELRAAMTHGPTRRNETGTDTMGRPNTGRRGELTATPFTDGNTSPGPHPDQLTIEDA